MQVRLYALGLKGLGYNVTKGSVVYLEEEDFDVVTVDDESLQNAKASAECVITNVLNGKFDPLTEEFCDVCDYQTICVWKKGKK